MKDISIENYTNISFNDSAELFREFSVKSQEAAYLPPINAENKDFGNDFPGNLIYKPCYNGCRFYNSQFKASNGAYSVFQNCSFFDCYFENANFNYCNIENCVFESKKNFSILSTGFNFGAFLKCRFIGIDFSGISFRDIYMEECVFDNCTLNNSSFERADIKNTKFINLDLRNVGIRYCRFHDITFVKTIFPILDLTNNIGLFSEIEKQQNEICFSLGYKKEVDLNEAKSLLIELLPYYKKTREYFSMINVFLLNEDYETVNHLLPIAMEHSIKQFDFDSLQNICYLLANTKMFHDTQLRKFYELIRSLIKPEKFPYNIQKGYAVFMNNIKNILLDNPNSYPCATILLSTDIDIESIHLLSIVIKDIENVTNSINPSIMPCIQLTHHSPYEVWIMLYGLLPDLLTICQTFYYTFGGIKSISDIKKSIHEKTENQNYDISSNHIIAQENLSNINFSFGPIKFNKETKRVVKKMEYYIN